MTRDDERWSTLRRLVTHRGTSAPSESRVSCGRLVACAAVAAALSGVLILTSLVIDSTRLPRLIPPPQPPPFPAPPAGPPPFPAPPAGPPPPPECIIDSTIAKLHQFIDAKVAAQVTCNPNTKDANYVQWYIVSENGYSLLYTLSIRLDMTTRQLRGRHDNSTSQVGREAFLSCEEDDDECIAEIERCRPGFEEVRALVCPR